MASGSAVSDPSLNGGSSTPDENEYPSGFPQSICDEVPKEKYLCSNCNNVLNKARQTVCGHRYCLACVNWLDHQSQCEYALIPCNIGCGIMVQRKSLATHLDRGCPNNKTTCPSCAGVLTPRELQVRLENDTLETVYATQMIFLINKLKEHESCSHVGHLQLLLDVTRALQRTLNSPPDEGEIETDGGDPGVSDKALSLHDDQAELAVGQQLDILQQRVQVMENIISALNREVEKTQFSVVVLERDDYNSQQLIQHLETKVKNLFHDTNDIHITSLQQCISAQQDVSYDGTFLWRLCDVSQRLREAATSHKNDNALCFSAFYTARYGFKVCMRLYLNGDGVGKGTHISLFFVIMKGEYDPILPWPFRYKVTFFLIDQNQREHVIDAFRPDLSSASFHRPTSDMNVASGCPLFFPLGKLRSPKHAYCKDDTIYIKCVVDTST
uniref:TNF receptor-associated factor n=1 Tax=Sinocyclocheilus grahami TaxID=75366 RepID=A0A672NRS9_SINGR